MPSTLLEIGVHGRSEDIKHYLSTLFGCHPLVVGVVGGFVANYLKKPGNFDAWAADEEGGLVTRFSKMSLVQRCNNILYSSINALPKSSHMLLCRLALLLGAVDYETAKAIGEPNNVRERKSSSDFDSSMEDLRRRGLLQWDPIAP